VVAVNVLPQAGSLALWEEYWRSSGGGDALFAEDTHQQAARSFGVRAAGTKVVIDRAGRIVLRESRSMPYERLRQLVERLL
jgi:hypothetical protein